MQVQPIRAGLAGITSAVSSRPAGQPNLLVTPMNVATAPHVQSPLITPLYVAPSPVPPPRTVSLLGKGLHVDTRA